MPFVWVSGHSLSVCGAPKLSLSLKAAGAPQRCPIAWFRSSYRLHSILSSSKVVEQSKKQRRDKKKGRGGDDDLQVEGEEDDDGT